MRDLLLFPLRPTLRLAAGLLAMAVGACGSGDDDAAAAQTGVFTDSPVAGLDVQGAVLGPRTPNAQGRFSYQAGETLSFSIDNLALGSASAAAMLTPLSITSGATAASDPRVTNKLILLQTLDADGDLNNGIQIGFWPAAKGDNPCQRTHAAQAGHEFGRVQAGEFPIQQNQSGVRDDHSAAQRLGVEPAACVGLEDSPTGARAVVAAGMTCYAVPDFSHTTRERFADITPHVFDTLHDVIALMRNGRRV